MALKTIDEPATHEFYVNNTSADVANTSISNEFYELELQEHEKEVEDDANKEMMEVCELLKEKGTEMKNSEEVLKAFRTFKHIL